MPNGVDSGQIFQRESKLVREERSFYYAERFLASVKFRT